MPRMGRPLWLDFEKSARIVARSIRPNPARWAGSTSTILQGTAGLSRQRGRDPVLTFETIWPLLQPKSHEVPGGTAWAAPRGALVCALSACCGLWPLEIIELPPAHWRPGGRDVVLTSSLRGIHRRVPRYIPLSPFVIALMEGYRQALPSEILGDHQTPLIRGANLKPMRQMEIDDHARRTAIRVGLKGATLAVIRARFELLIRGQDDGSGLVPYLLGEIRTHSNAARWLAEDPPDPVVRSFLKGVHPLWAPPRELWHRKSSRGRKPSSA
ncbi:hypothetical protein FHR70_003477 [Microvirga lupini]|uniref:Tyr recombinase domain-containing protein n=1 Tax=Microvirga lupini TaxID=420324 RepID=A0A7W4VNM0_9HYPH|nr:hypothetical protein [Microvirga lupini]